ncbi:acyl carrier protein phosphodiesterase [Granulosicoccus sp. 3-233]|uniref:acyl carrier protein phosphodiesterase n=1 Tax=Granulosicoccus sp. 3-233 TaxID=3417969 RepID=UPI003D3592F4
MNFLAHSLMGFDEAELIAGQICGDFVRGNELSRFPGRVETGIRLHRYLDRFTDTHPALQQARAGIDSVSYRFSGIVIDVMFDHFLACQWSRYSAHTLAAHADIVHAALADNHAHLPERLQRFTQVLLSERILESNVELASIELTLARLSQRSPRFASLAMAEAELEPLRDQLQKPFESFYPDLLDAARSYLG